MHELKVYQFLAHKFPYLGLDPGIDTFEKFFTLDRAQQPYLYLINYNGDTFEEFSLSYRLYDFMVEIKKDKINQLFYPPASYDLDTLDPIEWYDYRLPGFVIKRDYNTNQVMQYNCIVDYESMPEPEKQQFADFPHKDQIYIYGKKPYGKILYCYTERGKAHEDQKALQECFDYWKIQHSIDVAIGETARSEPYLSYDRILRAVDIKHAQS